MGVPIPNPEQERPMPTVDRLIDCARRANRGHDAGRDARGTMIDARGTMIDAMGTMIEHYRAAGRALKEAREECRRQGLAFNTWLKDNVRFSRARAYHYMALDDRLVTRRDLTPEQMVDEWRRISGNAPPTRPAKPKPQPQLQPPAGPCPDDDGRRSIYLGVLGSVDVPVETSERLGRVCDWLAETGWSPTPAAVALSVIIPALEEARDVIAQAKDDHESGVADDLQLYRFYRPARRPAAARADDRRVGQRGPGQVRLGPARRHGPRR
jgi:hypothetical protein